MKGHWKALAGVILVFLLGCVAGGLASSVFLMHRTALFFQRGAPAVVEFLERRSTRGLNLDASQKEQVHQAFMANLEQRKKLQEQIQPQVQDLNLQTFRQIRSILRPDQMEGFRKNLADLHRRFGRGRLSPTGLDPDAAAAPAAGGVDSTNAPSGTPPGNP